MEKSKVWHDVKERPKGKRVVILQGTRLVFKTLYTEEMNLWDSIVNQKKIKKWAYEKDIKSDDLYLIDKERMELDRKAMDEYWKDNRSL